MCFNKETSISAFIIGTLFTVLDIKKGYTKNDAFTLFFGFISIFIVIIQLLEYFIWRDIKNIAMNNKISLLIILITFFQPIIFLFIYSIIYKKPLPYWIIIVAIIYIFNNKSLFNLDNKKLITVVDKSSKKLLWATFEKTGNIKMLGTLLYWVMIGTLVFKLYKMNDRRMNQLLKNIGVITLFTLFVVYLYRPESFKKIKAIFSTLWCIFCIFIPIVVYITT